MGDVRPAFDLQVFQPPQPSPSPSPSASPSPKLSPVPAASSTAVLVTTPEEQEPHEAPDEHKDEHLMVQLAPPRLQRPGPSLARELRPQLATYTTVSGAAASKRGLPKPLSIEQFLFDDAASRQVIRRSFSHLWPADDNLDDDGDVYNENDDQNPEAKDDEDDDRGQREARAAAKANVIEKT